MGRFVGRVQALALALGAPGLFLVTFLDSSVLSLPEIPDLLVVWMVTQHKARLVVYVVSATLGSIAGCMVMYHVGRKGGDALLRKRFRGTSVDRAMKSFQRHGLMAVFIPSILPPPSPFKIFVLLAGVAEIGVGRFAATIAIGRGIRYSALGLLAVRYGDDAFAFIEAHEREAAVALVILIAAALAGYLVWTRAESRKSREDRLS